jgi:tetratricopeptide (TPR) repeat protein
MNLKTFVMILALLPNGWLVASAQGVPDLLQQGKVLLDQNRTDEAVSCFEKVLQLDGKNYDALVFLCNYYFLTGHKVLDSLETAYLVHESPTRMQVAQYNSDLKSIYAMYYSKAENYLIQAYLLQRNDHLDELAGQIADFKERIGILTPGIKKSWFKQTLLLLSRIP